MSFRDIARADIIRDEGLELKLYKCTAGKWSIGVGRNLEDRGITREEAMFLLDGDLLIAEADAKALFPAFDGISDARKAVLVNMALNLGKSRLAGFKRFRAAVADGDFEVAAAEMLNSQWAGQVGQRARRLSAKMKEG